MRCLTTRNKSYILQNCFPMTKYSSKYAAKISSFFDIVKNKFSSDATVECQPFKLFNLETGPATSVTLTKEQAKKMYYRMSAIRRLENMADSLYKEKFIRGFCHLYIGQEACCVGVREGIRDKDPVISAYRNHGWAYVSGLSMHAVLSELTGRVKGCCRGKGAFHMYGGRLFIGGNCGIVGAQIPIGTGVAFSCKYRGDGTIGIALYGDGAANQGQVFESFNMAALWKLPVIYICENNKFGYATSVDRAAANPQYYTRGDVVPGIWVDGMDVLAVRSATEFAVNYALKNGPIILELSCYRYHGHSMSDPGTSYRTREEVQEVREKSDPIKMFKNKCNELKLISDEEYKQMEEAIKVEVNDAAEKAKTDKEADVKELTYDLYSNLIGKGVRDPIGAFAKHELTNKPLNMV